MRLIDKILTEAELLESKMINFPDPEYNNMVVMMGSPGAGKTTTINTVLNLKNYKVLSSDSFIEILAKKFNLDLTDPDTTARLHYANKARARKLRDNWIDNQKGKTELPNVVIDVTGGNPDSIIRLTDKAREVGYSTTLVYVRTHIDTAIKRNNSRPRRVPTDKLVARYQEVANTYTEVFEEFDHVWVRNNDEEYVTSVENGKYKRPFNQLIKVK